MTVTQTLPRERAQRDAPADARVVSSFKCEDCGKIIAVPGQNPAPKCCGAEMRKIR